ncbi:hypothetical protein NR798_39955 [Archangium gephyra]|uniref:PD-(D/E)XK nuclease domain-containing protein n=1 Tax=Archangium gephyra TaxID=48 RepID=UPI0035D47D6F
MAEAMPRLIAPSPVSSPEESINHLEDLLERSNVLLQKEPTDAEMAAYRESLRRILEEAFEDANWWSLISAVGRYYPHEEYDESQRQHYEIREKNVLVTECIKDLKRVAARLSAIPAPAVASSLETLENILRQFHRVAAQLRKRHDGRKTLVIKDEYDVQDLLHALLLMHFSDIREEEHAPSFAGASPRLDFLLRNEEIVIEVKKTRPSQTVRGLCDELIADIARYQAHPNCKTLVCFIYDPEGQLSNVAGLIHDIQSTPSKIPVRVLVVPAG